jgi:hypothetical protein
MAGLTVREGGAIRAASRISIGGAVAQLGARLDGIEEVRGSNPLGSTISTQNQYVVVTDVEVFSSVPIPVERRGETLVVRISLVHFTSQ